MIEHMKMMQMPYLHIWSMLLPGQVTHRTNSSCFGVGYSRRKNQTGRRGGVGWGHSFFKKDLELLWFFSLLLKVWGKTKLHSWKFGKIMNVTSLENFKTKKKSLKAPPLETWWNYVRYIPRKFQGQNPRLLEISHEFFWVIFSWSVFLRSTFSFHLPMYTGIWKIVWKMQGMDVKW